MVCIRAVDCREDILDQTGFWQALHSRLAPDNPFVSPFWAEIWFDAHKKQAPGKVCLFSSHLPGEEGLVLLCRRKNGPLGIPVKSIESAGAGVSPGDRHFVAKQEPLLTRPAIARLVERLLSLKNWRFFRMAPVPASYPFYEAFAAAARQNGLAVLRRPYSTGYRIFTDCGWQAYEQSRPAKFRKNMRASQKKMSQDGDFAIRSHRDAQSETYLLETVNEISLKSWKSGAGTDVFNPAYQGFWEKLLRRSLSTGQSTLWMLYWQNRAIAYEWHFRQGDCIVSLKADYDSEFSNVSPGNRLCWQALQHAFESGARQIDFLMGGGDYKKKWATDRYQLDELLVFNRGGYARLWYQFFLRQNRLKALYSKWLSARRFFRP